MFIETKNENEESSVGAAWTRGQRPPISADERQLAFLPMPPGRALSMVATSRHFPTIVT